jgi:hypothetical protein
VALEQFSLVLAGRGRTGEDQRHRHFSDESQTASGVIELLSRKMSKHVMS